MIKIGVVFSHSSNLYPRNKLNKIFTNSTTENVNGNIYFVPKIPSPASPKPGTMYPFSFR